MSNNNYMLKIDQTVLIQVLFNLLIFFRVSEAQICDWPRDSDHGSDPSAFTSSQKLHNMVADGALSDWEECAQRDSYCQCHGIVAMGRSTQVDFGYPSKFACDKDFQYFSANF